MYYNLSQEDIRPYLTAGRAVITITSAKTGRRFIYKITVNKKDPNMFFVAVLGSDNSYKYMGIMRNFKFQTTAKSEYDAKSMPAVAFNFFLSRLDNPHPDMGVFHSGRCGRCGRELTDPESIKRGLGPTCARR